MQIGLNMEAGDCPTLNMNAMEKLSVKSFLNSAYYVRGKQKGSSGLVKLENPSKVKKYCIM